MAVTVKLTGRTRYRVLSRLFCKPLLILQVEEQRYGIEFDDHGGVIDIDFQHWRDAKIGDITTQGVAK